MLAFLLFCSWERCSWGNWVNGYHGSGSYWENYIWYAYNFFCIFCYSYLYISFLGEILHAIHMPVENIVYYYHPYFDCSPCSKIIIMAPITTTIQGHLLKMRPSCGQLSKKYAFILCSLGVKAIILRWAGSNYAG